MEDIRKYSGAILTGLAALVVVGALYVVFLLLTKLVNTGGSGSLPLLAIGGVVVLILLLTAVAMVFSILNLTNKDQAMGLPEGSIRAVIALSLIVLFAILSVFLFQSISTGGGSSNTIVQLSATERAEFIRSNTNARDIQSVESKTKAGTYDVSYRSANAASEDFAKQLLVLLGTLMTAITSFYLGAGTVVSAVKAGGEAAAATVTPPSPGSVKPETHSISTGGPLKLEIAGTNLNIITQVRIVKAGAQPIVGTNVKSSPTGIICDLDVSNATPGTWEIEIDDGVSKPIKLPSNLTLTA